MTELDALRRRLTEASPDFAPVAPAAIRARARHRRQLTGAASAGGAAVLAAGVVLVPRLGVDPAPPPVAAASATAPPSPVASDPPARACPPHNPNGIVDYVAGVRLNGRFYTQTAGLHGGVRPAVGARVGVVRCTLADIQPGPDYELVDGDATFLTAGTALHATPGVPASFRLITADGRVFESSGGPGVRTGGDLLPLRGLVTSIDVRGVAAGLAPGREPPLRRRITDPAEVRAVLDGIAAAPVVNRTATKATGRLLFRLTDGTVVQRDWSTPDRLLDGRIELPAALLAIFGR